MNTSVLTLFYSERVTGIATNTSCDPEPLQLFIGITYCDQKQKPCRFASELLHTLGDGKSSEVLDTDALHHKYRKHCFFLTKSKKGNRFKL
jgi:hypothetical protein